MSNPVIYNEKEIQVTGSWGVAILDKDDLRKLDQHNLLTSIMKIADDQLYLAKENGRNCVRFNLNTQTV